MVMTYNLRICFDRQYDAMANYTLWVEFLEPLLKGSRHTQMVIVLLIRALVNAINKEIWRAFLDRKGEVLAVWDKTRMRKEKAAQRLLTQASKPAALQIKEQVSLEIDQKLKQAKRKQETADTKKSAKKQKKSLLKIQGEEADPLREHSESQENMVTWIEAEAQALQAENLNTSNIRTTKNMVIMMITNTSQAAEAPDLLLPQVILQLTLTQFTEHQCTFLKTK